jgi:hypothetical protein
MKAYVRLDVLSAIIMKITIFGDLTQCNLIEIYLSQYQISQKIILFRLIYISQIVNCKLKVNVYISLLVRRRRPGAILLQIHGEIYDHAEKKERKHTS